MTVPAIIAGLIWATLTTPVVWAALIRIRRGPRPWTVTDAAFAFMGLLWVAIGTSLIVLLGHAESMSDLVDAPQVLDPTLMAWMVGCSLLGSGCAALFGWRRAGPAGIGLQPVSGVWVRNSVLLAFPLFGIFWGMDTLYRLAGLTPEPQDVSLAISQMPSGPTLMFTMLIVVVGAPIFEELVFRGFIQPALVRGVGIKAGVVLTAVLFMLIHGTNPYSSGPILLLGLVLGWLRLRTGSVYAPMVLHMANNAAAMVLVRVVGI